MKNFKKLYRKYLAHRKHETEQIVRFEMASSNLKQRAIYSDESLVNTDKRDKKVVVSLTTFGKRIRDVYLAIESIGQQTIKPDVIVLWLSKDEFNQDDLPVILIRMIKRGLKVQFIKDLRSYKKLIFALKKFPNDLIITIDDDIIYDIEMVEGLLKAHRKYPNTVCCHRSHLITKNQNGKLKPYDYWKHNAFTEEPSLYLVATGVAGILYFPGCFDGEVFNEDVFMKEAPTVDDLWFKVMTLINNVPVYNPDAGLELIPTKASKIGDLGKINCVDKENDLSLSRLINRYNLSI